MCRQRTALDMIKTQKDHCGLSDSALLLHEKQCEDFEAMQKEITEIKQDLSVVKETQENVIKTQGEMNKKIDNLIALVERKSSFLGNLKDVFSNKILTYVLCIVFTSVLAMSVGKFGAVLLKWLGVQ